MENTMYLRWMNNKDFRKSFLCKLDSFLKANNLNLDLYQSHPHHTVRSAFEYWLYNSDTVPVDNEEIKIAEDFKTPWDAFDYFLDKNKTNNIYFSKGYNQSWLMCIV